MLGTMSTLGSGGVKTLMINKKKICMIDLLMFKFVFQIWVYISNFGLD